MSVVLKTMAHQGAPEHLHKNARENLLLRFGIEAIAGEKARILMLVTGGSEAEAIRHLVHDQFQVLLASGRNNAYASATEVKAYANQHGFRNVLLNIDDEHDQRLFEKYVSVFQALESMKGKRLGLVGEVSDWLVASNVSDRLMKEKLGVELVQIPWKDAGDYRKFAPDADFVEHFHGCKHYNTEDASRVNSLLKKLIDEHQLDAITVECFSLVQENEVTACLGLSFLNDLGIPSGCEGDLCSILGMMLLKDISGEMPWMANVACIKENEVLFAHCTAPTSILSEYHVNTHFETGKGTAVNGRFDAIDVTVFRLNNTLDRLFYAHGKVVEGMYEKHACRTQLHVEFEPDIIQELKENPLGNHHLILPVDYSMEMEVVANILLD